MYGGEHFLPRVIITLEYVWIRQDQTLFCDPCIVSVKLVSNYKEVRTCYQIIEYVNPMKHSILEGKLTTHLVIKFLTA